MFVLIRCWQYNYSVLVFVLEEYMQQGDEENSAKERTEKEVEELADCEIERVVRGNRKTNKKKKQYRTEQVTNVLNDISNGLSTKKAATTWGIP